MFGVTGASGHAYNTNNGCFLWHSCEPGTVASALHVLSHLILKANQVLMTCIRGCCFPLSIWWKCTEFSSFCTTWHLAPQADGNSLQQGPGWGDLSRGALTVQMNCLRPLRSSLSKSPDCWLPVATDLLRWLLTYRNPGLCWGQAACQLQAGGRAWGAEVASSMPLWLQTDYHPGLFLVSSNSQPWLPTEGRPCALGRIHESLFRSVTLRKEALLSRTWKDFILQLLRNLFSTWLDRAKQRGIAEHQVFHFYFVFCHAGRLIGS